MATVTFDTLKFAETLKAHGLSEEQAKGIAQAFRDAQGEADLVTKKDLQIELAPVRTDLLVIKWMLGVVVAAEVMPWLVKLFA
jgi:Holliday junction resolvase-like predicted endonuclease